MTAPHPARAVLAAFSDGRAVDTTCHLGQWPFRLAVSANADDARRYAHRHGLSALWVSHLDCIFGFDTRTGNEACLDACAGDDLFRVLAVLDPSEGTWRDELEWALSRGAIGVRIAPGPHGYSLTAAVDLAMTCRERGVPLQLLVRLDDARVRHPRYRVRDPQPAEIARFLRETVGTTILVSGLRWDEWDEVARHLVDIEIPRVAADLWFVNGPVNVVDRMAAEPERWVFGSGFPVQTPESTMLQLAASHLSAAVRAKIIHENAARMLAPRPHIASSHDVASDGHRAQQR